MAEQSDVPLVPRVLERVGERREWMQPDGIHPNAGGHGQILENVWPTLERMLNDEASATSSSREVLKNHEWTRMNANVATMERH